MLIGEEGGKEVTEISLKFDFDLKLIRMKMHEDKMRVKHSALPCLHVFRRFGGNLAFDS